MTLAKIDDFMKYANFFYLCTGIEPYTRIVNSRQMTAAGAAAASSVCKQVDNSNSNSNSNRNRKDSSNNAYKKSSKSWLIKVIFYVNIINLSLVLLGELTFVLLALGGGDRVLEAIMNMAYIGFVLLGMSKLLSVWWKKNELSNFMHELEELFPHSSAEQQAYRLPDYLGFCAHVSFNYSLLYSILIWTYNLFSVIQYVVYECWLKTRIIGQTLPYNMYIPWQWEGHWSYYVLLVFQNLAGCTSAAGQMSTDLLLCAVATQIIMHYDYVARSIERYEMQLCSPKDNHAFLANMICYHERILRLSASINEIFGTPLLMNFGISSFTICFVGFQLTIGVTFDVFIKLILYLVSSMSQAILICYYGQLMEDASYGICAAAYNQNWFDSDLHYRKLLIFIMHRAQKTAYLRATVFIRVSRATITDLLQTSYKFFALLQTIYEVDDAQRD